jgi:hypothetical protein
VSGGVPVSRFFRFTQSDGRGFGIIRLAGRNLFTIIDANLSEDEAEAKLAAYRSKERGERPS